MMLSGSPRTSEASDFTLEQGCEVTGVLLQPLLGIAGCENIPFQGGARALQDSSQLQAGTFRATNQTFTGSCGRLCC